MNLYNIEFKSITNIKNIIIGKYHYKFKGINFFVNFKKPKGKLIIIFHGAIKNTTELPVFRGYNYDFKNINILSLSDKLLEIYNSLNIGWFLSSKKYNLDILYLQIIKGVIQQINTDDILFYGSSAGGFPSFYYASLLKQKCLIANSQMFIEKYTNYDKQINILKNNNDEFIIPNIEQLFLLKFIPKKIVMFVNINDTHHYIEHAKPFIKICKEHKIPIEYNPFNGILTEKDIKNNKTHHHIQTNKNLDYLLLIV